MLGQAARALEKQIAPNDRSGDHRSAKLNSEQGKPLL
jgi:hypothetical protein